MGLLTVLLPLAGGAACIAMLSRGMVAVMNVGGRCADNAMYAGAVACPKHTGLIMPLSIYAGLALVGLYAVRVNAEQGLNLTLWFWTALFWAMGWNFFAFRSRGDWSLILLVAMFGAMGAAPLLGMLNAAFPQLAGRFRRGVAARVAKLERMAVEPSSQWAAEVRQAAPQGTEAGSADPGVPAPGLCAGNRSAILGWLAGQLAAAVLGAYGGLFLFERLTR